MFLSTRMTFSFAKFVRNIYINNLYTIAIIFKKMWNFEFKNVLLNTLN